MNIDIKTIEEFNANGRGYGFTAIQTYKSDLFRVRTGQQISVLEFGMVRDCERIEIVGELRVDNDEDCWKILLKLRRKKLSEMLARILKETATEAYVDGRNSLKKDFRKLIMDCDYDND